MDFYFKFLLRFELVSKRLKLSRWWKIFPSLTFRSTIHSIYCTLTHTHTYIVLTLISTYIWYNVYHPLSYGHLLWTFLCNISSIQSTSFPSFSTSPFLLHYINSNTRLFFILTYSPYLFSLLNFSHLSPPPPFSSLQHLKLYSFISLF